MNLTGSLFVEESVDVHDMDDLDGKWPVTILFDGSAGLGIHMTHELAVSLVKQLDQVLQGIAFDSEEQADTCEHCGHKEEKHYNPGGGADDICFGDGEWPARGGSTCRCPHFLAVGA